jgi:hypothetical protein
LEFDIQKIKMTSRVKNFLIQKLWAGLDVSPGSKLCKTKRRKYKQRVTCSKLSSVVAMYSKLPRERTNLEKGLLISKRNRKRKALVKL